MDKIVEPRISSYIQKIIWKLALPNDRSTNHFFESSYFNVEGMDKRAESTFLREPPLTLHSIYTETPTFIRQPNVTGENSPFPK